MWPLSNLLRTFVSKGTLTVYDADGKAYVFGSAEERPSVAIRLHDRALYWQLFLNPELHAAEAYMDDRLSFEEGSDCYDLLHLFSINRGSLAGHRVQGLLRRGWRAMRRRQQRNDADRSRAHARHHYDVSIDLYRLFLDEDLNYSCAFYRTPNDTLEEAQAVKLDRVAAKLMAGPGMSVLDIGGGWGSLAIHLAKGGSRVTSINVSPEQIAVAKERAEDAGVADRVTFLLKDYREVTGRFDRVVSIGMMEHVGIGHLDEYFAQVRDLLEPDGYGLIHSIGRMTPPGTTGPFFRKYIFPGGCAPALSETFAATERQGLWVADMEVLRLHYYYTLREWRCRFAANRDKAKALYDERFCRMWEFYLGAAELGFLNGSNMVFQLLLATRRDAVPIDRDVLAGAARKPIDPSGHDK